MGEKFAHQNQPTILTPEYPSRLDTSPFQRPSSTARPHHRPVQINASPTISPRVGLRARTRAIETVLGRRLGGEVGRMRRGISGGARGSCGGMSRRAGRGSLMGMSMRVSTVQVCLGHCEKAVGGNSPSMVSICMYMHVLECLRYLLLAGLRLYLSIFKRKPFPLRLEKPSLSASPLWIHRFCRICPQCLRRGNSPPHPRASPPKRAMGRSTSYSCSFSRTSIQ